MQELIDFAALYVYNFLNGLTQIRRANMTDASNALWYNHPAKTWVHTLLLGNGSLGAALYGRTDTETV